MHFDNETLNRKKIIAPHDSDLVYYKEENDGNIIREGILNVENGEVEINLLSETNSVTTQKVDHENFNIIENKEFKPLSDQIRIGHLNSEERSQLLQIINRYHNIFYQESDKLSFTSAIKHRIRTTNNIPIFSKSYRYPYVHKKEVTDQIQEMLKNKIIRNSNSPYSAPIWIVPKKADASGKPKWRLVIDYRKLNEVTIDDKFPIPNIDEILEKLGRSQKEDTTNFCECLSV